MNSTAVEALPLLARVKPISASLGRLVTRATVAPPGWMNSTAAKSDQFRGARRRAEAVIGSPTVTPSGQLLSTSSSSPQVPIRGIDGRFRDVDEVVGAAVFFASDDAAFITGHTLAIDTCT